MIYFTKNNNLYRSLAKVGTAVDYYRSSRWECILQWENAIFKLDSVNHRVPDLYIILRGAVL